MRRNVDVDRLSLKGAAALAADPTTDHATMMRLCGLIASWAKGGDRTSANELAVAVCSNPNTNLAVWTAAHPEGVDTGDALLDNFAFRVCLFDDAGCRRFPTLPILKTWRHAARRAVTVDRGYTSYSGIDAEYVDEANHPMCELSGLDPGSKRGLVRATLWMGTEFDDSDPRAISCMWALTDIAAMCLAQPRTRIHPLRFIILSRVMEDNIPASLRDVIMAHLAPDPMQPNRRRGPR